MSISDIRSARKVPEAEYSVYTDTQNLLNHAKVEARRRNFSDWLICDIDAHHTETISWKEVVEFIEDPVLRQAARDYHSSRWTAAPYGLNGDFGLRYQGVGGRIMHQEAQREEIKTTSVHRDVTLTRRAMNALGIDYMVVFPTPMLFLGMHPQHDMEVVLTRAYTRWTVENLLKADPRIKTLIALPFNTPSACEKMVKEFNDAPGVIGYCVSSVRNKAVHHND